MRHPLTPRLVAVLEGMAEGHTNKAIAERLGIAVPTVNALVDTLMRRLGARNRPETVAQGFREGVLRWNREDKIAQFSEGTHVAKIDIDWLVKVARSARAVNEIVMETRESTKEVGYEAFALAHDELHGVLEGTE